ncbi:MAG: hypothetical protein KDC79_08170 [Cyclobacteriaceae bacterium]|nr:hypothetical protein [Cyclobacteriaceae bacterium]
MKTIGILKEPNNDNRVCMLPDTVKKLVSQGINVLFESHAGTGLGEVVGFFRTALDQS